MLIKIAFLAAVALAATGTTANAGSKEISSSGSKGSYADSVGGYDISSVGDKGSYVACTAINTYTDVAFVGVGDILSVLLTGKDFRVDKGDKVDGFWSVDGSKDRPLSNKADGKNTVSADMEANKASLDLFSSGDKMTVTVGKATLIYDLSGSKQALNSLGSCMDTISSK